MTTVKHNNESFPQLGTPSGRLILAFSLDPSQGKQLELPIQNDGKSCFFDIEITPEQFNALYDKMTFVKKRMSLPNESERKDLARELIDEYFG
jgi:hypothetical protein